MVCFRTKKKHLQYCVDMFCHFCLYFVDDVPLIFTTDPLHPLCPANLLLVFGDVFGLGLGSCGKDLFEVGDIWLFVGDV